MDIKAGTSLYVKSRKSALERAISVLFVIIFVLCAFTLFFNIRYSGVYVVQDSMLPTLVGAPTKNQKGGDFVYMDMYATAGYGDIVVIETDRKDEDGSRISIIKRAIAFGGDRVMIDGGKVYIKYASKGANAKFELLNESYVAEENNSPIKNNFPDGNHDPTSTSADAGHEVEKGCVFCLGDNRNDSRDSRMDGDYKRSNIKGVVPAWALKIKDFTTKLNQLF